MSKGVGASLAVAAALAAALLTMWVSAPPALGQSPAPSKSAPASAGKPAPAPAPAPNAVAMPEAEKVVLLVRSTLLTLADAVQTGNFTVLRDKGAPGFRDANSAAKLSQIFASMMAQGIDLTAVSVLTPVLAEPPQLDQQNGMLRIKGSFPGQPVRIDFDLMFQAVGGRWMLFGISANPVTETAQAPAARAPAPAAAPKAAPAAAPAAAKK